ncbi:MAG TPA: Hsp70 family protein [Blastocatellia bacterium]|jgi:molecular chaperone DnaK (HSP70)|nr:Hsp70 family protein [Blastocatellia bacterium]
MSRYLIGIDLGTTNSAVAYIDTNEVSRGGAAAIRIFQIPQLVAEGEPGESATLPSFLYFAGSELAEAGLTLPWQDRAAPIVGILAREQGALVPGRQVSSAKSWLSHAAVDRTAKILPWGAEQPDFACSPVEASTRYLAHLRDGWNHTFAPEGEADESRFERQEIVLTVPASFDEEARELTAQAAHDAGIKNLTLLEEPLAAFYAWIVAHRTSLKRRLKDGDLVLICDVGGGTTDFSLVRVHIDKGEIRFERTAIGEHLLLGGDNVDLALARRVEEKLRNPKLTLRQRNALVRACCAAKERLLSNPEGGRAPINILGSGRAVVGGTLSAELTREEVEETLVGGFLPLTASDDLPRRERRTGLRELGLPYATEPAITKHLAEFLTRSFGAEESRHENLNAEVSDSESRIRGSQPGGRQEGSSDSDISNPKSKIQNPKSDMARPDAVLFNGGFFTPAITRERIIEALVTWFREKGNRYRPKVLSNEAPEAAVAIGAAYYGQVRRGGGLRISGGSARAYYVGVQAGAHKSDAHKSDAHKSDRQVQAVCVMPRGTEEGTTLELADREFSVLTNRPVSFTLYSSTTRHDQHGDVVALDEAGAHRHAPLITVLRYGKKSREAELSVRLTVKFTEVGTLELWCESLKTEHRWRLQFQLRGADLADEAAEPERGETETVIPDEAIERAARLIRAVFGGPRDEMPGEMIAPESLVGRLEAALGYGKDAWPMAAIRKLCDVTLDAADGRKKSARYEARWLNLFGFCLRPGFGAAVDDWRMTQARKIYLAGLAFPKDIQCQVEWFVLWRRVAGGLTAGQQIELYQRLLSALGIGGKKQGGRLNTQIEHEGLRLLASLEHLPAQTRVGLGRSLLARIKEKPANKGYLWSLGRLGARIPFYGPLNSVVPADTAAEWIKALLNLPEMTTDAASAVVQLGARTEDAGRDVSDALRDKAIARLAQAGIPDDLIESLRAYVPPARSDAQRIFGESLPEGLRLVV